MRKALLLAYFGDLPAWADKFTASLPPGYEPIWVRDPGDFRKRVRDRLGIDCPTMAGTGKIHDYRAALGALYQPELAGFDFWGHTDLDVVFGRPDRFMPDEQLAELDVDTDHWEYLCGPWTLYRNRPDLNNAFREHGFWKEILADPTVYGWVETAFTMIIASLGRVNYALRHSWDAQGVARLERAEDGTLTANGREVSFFHFRQTKRWPRIEAAA